MAALFESGRIVDLILAFMLLEAVLVCGLVLVRRNRLPARDALPSKKVPMKPGKRAGILPGLLLNLAAGACLLLVLRAVLTEAGWTVAGAWLLAALAAHIGDLIQRFRR